MSEVTQRFNLIPSRWIIASGNDAVYDGSPGKNSPFASSLIQILKNNPKDTLSIFELAEKAAESTFASKFRQIPISGPLAVRGHQGGIFFFIRKKNTENLLSHSLFNINTENDSKVSLKNLDKIAWNDTLQKNTFIAYQKYIEDFPDGTYTKEAKIIVNLLSN